MHRKRFLTPCLAALAVLAAAPSWGQSALPRLAYIDPPGLAPNSTREIRLGGYDWTPDMQVFFHDEHIRCEILDGPGEALVPPPPYWFGAKSFLASPPIPREMRAILTIAPGAKPGPVRWQVANANGGSATGVLMIGDASEILEDAARKSAQPLPALPVTVNGRLARIAEVDRYTFHVDTSGLVTCELLDRLGQPFNAILRVFDAQGRMVADYADTEGRDCCFTFAASAPADYEIRVQDVDFRGDRAYVYRLSLRQRTQVDCALPSGLKRGETRPVEFVGIGLASGAGQLESIIRDVTCPNDPGLESLAVELQTPGGPASFVLAVDDLPELVESVAFPAGPRKMALPAAVTGRLDDTSEDSYECDWHQGEIWRLRAQSAHARGDLDLALAVQDANGKELARNDDLPPGTDAGLDFTVPADGTYRLVVEAAGAPLKTLSAAYRLAVDQPERRPDFQLEVVDHLDLPLGGTADLIVKAVRRGNEKDPIPFAITGLPAGVTASAELVIPPGQSELKVPLTCAADSAVTATLANIEANCQSQGKNVTRAARVLVAITMKPRCKLEPLEKDGGRTVHRGTTFPAEVIVQRLEGFEGPIQLLQAAQQERHRQGINGHDMVVPPGVTHVAYPVYLPEWLETNRTSRIVLIAVAQVPDPRGTVRHVASAMQGRITMSIEGALLKLAHVAPEMTVRAGESFKVPLVLSRSAKLPLEARIELVAPEGLETLLIADPLVVAPDRGEFDFEIHTSADPRLAGSQKITIRATAMQDGTLRVVSQTELTVEFVEPPRTDAAASEN